MNSERMSAILKHHRATHRLSQVELAAKTGVSLATISRIERAQGRDTRVQVVAKIAFAMGRADGSELMEAAGLDVGEMLFIDDDEQTKTDWLIRGLSDEQVAELERFADYLRDRSDGDG